MTDRTLILPIGIPGSGKTTFMNEIGNLYNIPVISSDKVREQLYGDEQIQGDYEEVFSEVYRQVNESIRCGVCILDATHCTRWSRWAAIAKVCPDRVIYVIMNNDLERALHQNANRERVCPEYVIRRMYKNFLKEPPKKDEARNLCIYSWGDPELKLFLEVLV